MDQLCDLIPPYAHYFRLFFFKQKTAYEINVSYVTGQTWTTGQEIASITDTLGRVVNFTYDGTTHLLSQVTGGGQTYAFNWNEGLPGGKPLNYAFTGLTVTGTPGATGTLINVLTSCTAPNGTKTVFSYGDWGIVNTIQVQSNNGTVRGSVGYNYPTSRTALSDHPTFTAETVSDGV